ncbi:Os12g0144200 [Oryza sativa Japonica Group]|uniref:Dirigent protein n=1 Tax=Oryza sativa subsp. japonica TaxID=39947 RepID=A0A0P0Y725_ORYSJ|nr:hypothetical protein EE612_057743 [Oryza sativa]BAT15869.1 Os12g0144200 [Oryza sativa Japonica Group]
MAYPPSSGYPITGSSLQVTPCGALVEQYNELNFRNLYLHHLYLGPNPTQSVMLAADAATGLGATTVNNWPIYDGLGSLVARARGLHVYAGDWHNSFTIVFEDQRYPRDIKRRQVSVENGEWGIVGGTGQFAMAGGVIQKRVHQRRNDGNIIEITIHGFCPVSISAKPSH